MAIPFSSAEIHQTLNKEITLIVRKSAEQVLRTLVLSTPVGNPALWKGNAPAGYRPGTHRGAWRVTIGKPNNMFDSGVRDTVGGATIQKGLQVLRRFNIKRKRIIIQNAAPAIERLNNGWSTQAPAGFVERAALVGTVSTGDIPRTKEI